MLHTGHAAEADRSREAHLNVSGINGVTGAWATRALLERCWQRGAGLKASPFERRLEILTETTGPSTAQSGDWA
jgi:hypothetical protein